MHCNPRHLAALIVALALVLPAHAGASRIGLTWMGVTQWLMKTPVGYALLDAYMSRPPFGPAGPTAEGLDLYREIADAARVRGPVRWLFIGHSHFDHALDVGPLALETGAMVIGSQTTCFIAESQGVPPAQCLVVAGGETLDLDPRLEVRVVRVPHFLPASIGLFQELTEPPASAVSAPNGGNLGFLFRLKTRSGKHKASWFYVNSIAPIDSDDGSGVDFTTALSGMFATAEAPDVWLTAAFGGTSTMGPYLDIVQPAALVPMHWDGLFPVVTDGLVASYNDEGLTPELVARDIELIVNEQYLDKIKIGRRTRLRRNRAVKLRLGLPVN